MKRCLVLFLTVAIPLLARASEWYRFRGPNGSGVSDATGVPVAFSSSKSLLWRTPLLPGHSSPVLAGDRVFVTGFEADRLVTLALSAETGKVLWRGELPRLRSEHHHANNGPATPSPVTDGINVYSFFQDFGVVSYGVEGKEKWRLSLGPFRNYKGMGASPILVGGTLVLACDQDVGSFLLALDSRTGAVRWRTERTEIPGNGHSTPAVYESPQGTQLIVLGASQITGYRLDTGAKVWWVGGLSIQPKTSPVITTDASGRAIVYVLGPGAGEGPPASFPSLSELLPTLDKDKDGRVTPKELGSYIQADADGDGVLSEREYLNFMSSGSVAAVLLAINPAGQGDLTKTGVLWQFRKSLPLVPSPIVYQGAVYLVKEGGILTALDATTGALLKQVRLSGALDNYYASPVAADGKLYLTSQAGHIVVVRAQSDLEILAVNDLDEECFATPAVAPGRLYVRTRGSLWCFGESVRAGSNSADGGC